MGVEPLHTYMMRTVQLRLNRLSYWPETVKKPYFLKFILAFVAGMIQEGNVLTNRVTE